MSASVSIETKKLAVPVASALMLASALALQSAQEPDFSKLSMPRPDTNPVPTQVEKRTNKQDRSNIVSAEQSHASEKAQQPHPSTTEKKTLFPIVDAEERKLLGKIAGVVSLCASALFARQTFKNGTTSKRGWIVTTFNEGLIAATSFALGTIDNFWLPASFVVGSGITTMFALKFGKKEPLTTTEKLSGWAATAGWLCYLANMHDPVWAAIAGQIGYHASNLAFMELFYKKPGEITIPGQALYFASAAINIFAISTFLPREVISPFGLAFGIFLSSAALALGHLREWRARRKSSAEQ